MQLADAPGRGEPGTGRARLRALVWANSTQPATRGNIGLEYRPSGAQRGQLRVDGPAAAVRSAANEQRSVSSDWASWADRWRRTWSRAGHEVDRLQPAPVQDRAAGRGEGGAAASSVAEAGRATPTSSSPLLPDSPDVEGGGAGRGRGAGQRPRRGFALIRLAARSARGRAAAHRSKRAAAVDFGWSTRRSAAESLKAIDGTLSRDGRRGVEEDFPARPGKVPVAGGLHRSCTSARSDRRSDGEGGQPARRRRQHRAAGRGPGVPGSVRGGDWPGPGSAGRRARRERGAGRQGEEVCASGSSLPVSGSELHARTSASWTTPPASGSWSRR